MKNSMVLEDKEAEQDFTERFLPWKSHLLIFIILTKLVLIFPFLQFHTLGHFQMVHKETKKLQNKRKDDKWLEKENL